MAGDAIFTEVVLGSLGLVHHVGETSFPFSTEIYGLPLCDLFFDGVEVAFGLASGPKILLHRLAAGDVEILMIDSRLIWSRKTSLADGAGNHHAGEAGHGHLVDALGEILSLADGGFRLTWVVQKMTMVQTTTKISQIAADRRTQIFQSRIVCPSPYGAARVLVRRSDRFAGLCQPRRFPRKNIPLSRIKPRFWLAAVLRWKASRRGSEPRRRPRPGQRPELAAPCARAPHLQILKAGSASSIQPPPSLSRAASSGKTVAAGGTEQFAAVVDLAVPVAVQNEEACRRRGGELLVPVGVEVEAEAGVELGGQAGKLITRGLCAGRRPQAQTDIAFHLETTLQVEGKLETDFCRRRCVPYRWRRS